MRKQNSAWKAAQMTDLKHIKSQFKSMPSNVNLYLLQFEWVQAKFGICIF